MRPNQKANRLNASELLHVRMWKTIAENTPWLLCLYLENSHRLESNGANALPQIRRLIFTSVAPFAIRNLAGTRFGFQRLRMVVVFVMSGVFTGIACERANSLEKKDANPPLEARPTHAGRSDEINIELTNSGFIPTEIIHSAGAFGIAVENKSDANEYKLRLKAEDGSILKEIPVQKGSVAWSVNLQPGQYRLTEANHEQWVCVIIVQ